MKEKKRYRYKGRDLKSIKKRASGSSDFDSYLKPNLPRFKVENGSNTIRILPPADGIDQDRWGDQWGIEVYVHYSVGPDNASFLCLQKMKKKRCALCDARHELDEDEDEELIRSLKPNRRILCWLVDRDSEKDGPVIWAMPQSLEKEIQIRSQNKKTNAALLIDHPDKGYDVTFERTGKGMQVKYEGVDIERQRSPISERSSKQNEWLEYINENPLPSLLKFYDPSYIEEVFMGKRSKKEEDIEEDEDELESEDEDNDDDDDDDDDEPKKKKKSKSKSKKSSDDDDDDDDDKDKDDDDDDDDDDDEPKKKKGKKSKKKSKDDDDDEDDDDDVEDDDDDDKPKKKKKKGKSSDDDDNDDDDEDKDDDNEDNDDDDDDDEDEDEKKKKGKAKKGNVSKATKESMDRLKKRRAKG